MTKLNDHQDFTPKAISPNEERFRALVTATSDVIYSLSADWSVMYPLDGKGFLKDTQEPITGWQARNVYADDLEMVRAAIDEAIRTKSIFQLEHRIVRTDDTPGWTFSRAVPILDDNGEILEWFGTASDITERKLAEEVLNKAREQSEKNERYFRQLADLVPAKISNALPTGELTFCNKQWLDFSGLSFEDLRDFGYNQMMHPDEIEEFHKGLTEAAKSKVPYESEVRFRDRNGNYKWHLNIASPILDEDGQITMWVGSTTDIQRIKEEEQRKSDFIGMVSHELKTPLTSLNAYLQLLQVKTKKSGDGFENNAVNQAIKQTRKMTAMINGFLNVSRLESSAIHINKQLFNIMDLLEETQDEMLLLTATHQLNYKARGSVMVSADREKIGHVLNNMISNACKYSESGSAITIDCQADNEEVILSVTDQGGGIKSEDIKRIFDRYYRVENNNTISGFGIGLYLCAEIIKRHGGEIWVESELGKGSTFYFSLPIDFKAK